MSQVAETDYFCIMANSGTALEAAAHARGVPVKLTHIAVGDGNGQVPVPTQRDTKLVNEVYRRKIDGSRVDEDDPNICWIHIVVPADVGGFWIREFAIYAEALEEGGDPVLYALGNHAPYYKTKKVLGQATTHQLEIPIIMSGAAEVEIVVKDTGYASQEALNETNRILTEVKNGYMPLDLCEFYFFRKPDLKAGFEPLTGCVIEDAATRYPKAWEYLQTTEGQKLCKTLTEWQNLSTMAYYTLADGTTVGFNGIGGVPFYALNTANGSLKMPDIRGMHLEAAGFDSLNVANCAIDTTRPIQGNAYIVAHAGVDTATGGAFRWNVIPFAPTALATGTDGAADMYLDSGRVVPISPATRPRSLAVLACAYMGQPAL